MHISARLSRCWPAIAATAVVAVLAAGCGSSDVSGAPEKRPSQSRSATKEQEREKKPEPSAGSSGGATSGNGDPGSGGGTPTGEARERKLPAELDTDSTVKALRSSWEQCQKRSGYTQPTADSKGNVVIKDTPELRAAERACKGERKALDKKIAEIMEQGKK
ncbi:hypothetical protein [Streptomyces sp. NPDC048636]|uniref:hypothetical protein n=1 Tax=Streptomyces sp. NPDC048636 TaxID=3155762 RepID=UPI003449C979